MHDVPLATKEATARYIMARETVEGVAISIGWGGVELSFMVRGKTAWLKCLADGGER